MGLLRALTGIVAAALIAVSVWQLESFRSGLEITPLTVDGTPASLYRLPNAKGPAVVVAHGFAGSRQLMEAYALTLARAGYLVVSFDFAGHGRNPVPMGGDVTRVQGTTQRLVAETAAIVEAARALPGADGRVALLGHSMATDVLVRLAQADHRIAAVVAVSMYSEAVTPTTPQRLLMISGAWEGYLRAAALDQLRKVDPSAAEGETAVDASGRVTRRAVVAPMVEHVGVLYSPAALGAARDWLNDTFDRRSTGAVAATGGWIVLLLGAIVLLAWPLAALLPERGRQPDRPGAAIFLAATVGGGLVTPLLLTLFDTRILPVLVADYLALHLLVYGAVVLALLARAGVRVGPWSLLATLLLLVYGLVAFGGALDRYVASFVPHAGRIPVLLAIAVGAVPFMLADSLLSEGGRAPLWRRVVARLVFFASLGIAVALDFERLFFLVIVLPVIVLFFLVFGLMGRWVGLRTGAPAAPGLALGLILAWALGVTFPLFAP